MATRSDEYDAVAKPPEPAGVPVRRPNAVRSKRLKSEVTRDRLCGATLQLIERTPLRQIKVSDIADLAKMSSSTFYIYFADVEAAVLALLGDLAVNMPDLAARVRVIAPDRLARGARAMLLAYLAFWDANYALLRIRNLAADEGEERFRDARSLMLGPILAALTDKLIEFRGQRFGPAATPAMSVAAVILGSMERLASLVRVHPSRRELQRRGLIDAEVLLICEMLRGPVT